MIVAREPEDAAVEPFNLDAPALLHLAAGLHTAAGRPQRWPQAWQACCQALGCPTLLDQAATAGNAAADPVHHLATQLALVRLCAAMNAARGAQPAAPDPRCSACNALLPHLQAVLARWTEQAQDHRGAVLDLLQTALFVCDAQRRLLYCNAAAERELAAGRWLVDRDGQLAGAHAGIDRRLADLLADAGGGWAELPGVGSLRAQLRVRPMPAAGAAPGHLLQLTAHHVADPERLAALASALKLTPRQLELCTCLLDGHSLVESARRLGIARGTAHELLKRLFEATGTRRQSELLAHLAARLHRP